MSGTHLTVERLLQDLLDQEDVSLVTGSGGDGLFTSFLNGRHGPFQTFTMNWETLTNTVWLKLEGEQWTLFTRLGAIQRVCFDRRPDGHAPEKESLTVRLHGQKNDSSLTFAFGHLYDEQGQPIPAQFARWEDLRAMYGGREELRVENGSLIPVAEGES